jgi:hypothetical protein
MSIYTLYIKRHQITGLKYLGYTSALDPISYRGSGKYWSLHIKKHGYLVDTETLYKTSNINEIKELGSYYSELWNIVESADWANLKPESGNGGWVPGLSSKTQQSRIANGTHHFLSGDISRKSNKKRIENGTHNFLGQTNPTHKRIENKTHHFYDGNIARNNNLKRLAEGTHTSQIKKTCEWCGKICDVANFAKYHGSKCKQFTC